MLEKNSNLNLKIQVCINIENILDFRFIKSIYYKILILVFLKLFKINIFKVLIWEFFGKTFTDRELIYELNITINLY